MTNTETLRALVDAVEAARSKLGAMRPDSRLYPEDAVQWDALTRVAALLSAGDGVAEAAAPVAESKDWSPRQSDEYAQDVRHLIVCDTQFGWTGETTLKLPELTRLVERGWMSEGEENAEYDVTDEGRLVIEQALRATPHLDYDDSCPYGAPNCSSADDATNCPKCAADIASAAAPAVEVDEDG